MPEEELQKGQSFAVGFDQPLVGIIVEEGDREVVRYFTDERDLEAASTPASRERALSLLGA